VVLIELQQPHSHSFLAPHHTEKEKHEKKNMKHQDERTLARYDTMANITAPCRPVASI
jgi:hypothetical protein